MKKYKEIFKLYEIVYKKILPDSNKPETYYFFTIRGTKPHNMYLCEQADINFIKWLPGSELISENDADEWIKNTLREKKLMKIINEN